MRPPLGHSRCLSVWATGFVWWRHQLETFSALLAHCAGNSPVTGEFPEQRPVTRSFDVFFDLRLNERLSKQSWGWWFETPLRSLWRHCNGFDNHRTAKTLTTVSESELVNFRAIECEDKASDTFVNKCPGCSYVRVWLVWNCAW